MSLIEYKGYLGTVEYSAEDHCLYGKLVDVRDLVSYEATTVEALEREFEAAVDSYLETCQKQGREPHQPCKGTFNVRIGSELHREAMMASVGSSLNDFVREAIKEKLERGLSA